MRARLPIEECIDTPSTIDPDVNALPTQGQVDVDHIRRFHGPILTEELQTRHFECNGDLSTVISKTVLWPKVTVAFIEKIVAVRD